MTNYCPECKRLYEEEKCPVCGKRRGREPQEDDPCFLLSVGAIWTEMAADALNQHQIPFLKTGSQGAAMALFTGLYNETFDFYVSYKNYAEAKELTDALFAPAEEEAEEVEDTEAETEEEETEEEEEEEDGEI